MKAIVRQSYLDKIAKHLGKDTNIIIVGQRRVGKGQERGGGFRN